MDQCGVWTCHALAVTLTDIHQKRRKSKRKKEKIVADEESNGKKMTHSLHLN